MRCNRKELAEIIGVDVKTIDAMVQKGMPYVRRPEGKARSWVFDTAAVLNWLTRAAIFAGSAANEVRGASGCGLNPPRPGVAQTVETVPAISGCCHREGCRRCQPTTR